MSLIRYIVKSIGAHSERALSAASDNLFLVIIKGVRVRSCQALDLPLFDNVEIFADTCQ